MNPIQLLIELLITIVMLAALFALAWSFWCVGVELGHRWVFARNLRRWIAEVDAEIEAEVKAGAGSLAPDTFESERKPT